MPSGMMFAVPSPTKCDLQPSRRFDVSFKYLFLMGFALFSLGIAGRPASAQSINIFGNAVPEKPVGGAGAATVGVKFFSSEPGAIAGIRFYRGVTDPDGYVARLYTAGGTLLGSATLSGNSCSVPCWEIANFASPIPISANTTYVAAYYSDVGGAAWEPDGLSNGATNGPLTAPASSVVGGNGVQIYANAFPSGTFEDSNWYVDVAFVPTAGASSYLVLSFNPPNPGIPSNASLGSVVATILVSWSDGSPFTGTLGFAQPYSNDGGVFAISGNNLIINPTGPGVSPDANTTLNVTIVATP
jgi:hypothetical protein